MEIDALNDKISTLQKALENEKTANVAKVQQLVSIIHYFKYRELTILILVKKR